MGSTRSVRRLPHTALLLALLAGAGSLALAQPEPPARAEPPARPPVLRGPTVDETGIPGTERAFSMGGAPDGPQARMLNREVPMGEFLAAFRALNAPDTARELNLTGEQRAALGQIAGEHARAVREYLAEQREELAALGATLGFEADELAPVERAFADRPSEGERRARRAAARGADAPTPTDAPSREGGRQTAEPGQAPSSGQSPEELVRARVGPNPTPQQREAMARLREIRAGAPSALEAQTRAWNTLSEPQQQFVQARLDEARARMQAQRGEMYVEQMSRQIEAERMPRGQQGAPRADLPPGEAAARLHRLIDDLTPREQAMLLRLLESRLPELRARAAGQSPQGGPGQNRPRGQGESRPKPPEMEQINVPSAGPV